MTRLEAARGSSVPGALALGEVDDPALTEAVAGRDRRARCATWASPTTSPRSPTSTRTRATRSSASAPSAATRARRAPRRGVRDGPAGGRRRRLREALPGPRRDGGRLAPRPAGRSTATREELRSRSSSCPSWPPSRQGALSLMTAHIVVPALDDAARDAEPRGAHGPAARRARVRGHGRSPTRSRWARSAARTGWARPRCSRSSPAPTRSASGTTSTSRTWRSSATAIVAAVREGRLPEERLAEAAARVAGVACARTRAGPERVARRGGACGGAAGAAGDGRRSRLGTRCSSSSSREPCRLRPGRPRTTSSMSSASSAPMPRRFTSAPRIRCRPPWRRIAAAARWWSRGTSTGTPGSASAVAAIAAADPRTVIVDVGYPSREPLPARGVVTTFGAGRASLTAAAERLTQLTALTARLVDAVAAELVELGGEQVARARGIPRRRDRLAVHPHRAHLRSVPTRQRDLAPEARAQPARDELRIGPGPLDAQLLDRGDPRPQLGEPAPPRERSRVGDVRDGDMSEERREPRIRGRCASATRTSRRRAGRRCR